MIALPPCCFRLFPMFLLVILTGCKMSSIPRWSSKDCDQARLAIHSQQLHPGQNVSDALKLINPYRVDHVGRYTFIELQPPVIGRSSFFLTAIDGRLTTAHEFGCLNSEMHFNTLSEDELSALAYEYTRHLDRLSTPQSQ